MHKILTMPTPRIRLREVPSEAMETLFPLIKTLNPKMTKKQFLARLEEMLPRGYRAVAAYDGDTIVGLSGFWIGMRFWCGRQLDIDNFVVNPAYRGQKIGEKMMAWLEKTALAEACDLMVLDVYADNFLAHRFYHRAGFTTTGYHYSKIPGSRTPYSRKD